MIRKPVSLKNKRLDQVEIEEQLLSGDLLRLEEILACFRSRSYDSQSDVFYGALRDFEAGYGVTKGSMVLRYDLNDCFTGITLLDASKQVDIKFLKDL